MLIKTTSVAFDLINEWGIKYLDVAKELPTKD